MKIEHNQNFMAHQYMPKIFHGRHKNTPTPPPTYLIYVAIDEINAGILQTLILNEWRIKVTFTDRFKSTFDKFTEVCSLRDRGFLSICFRNPV